MTTLKMRYVDRFRDRHGTVRHYFRRPGGRRIALPGQPGSEEFMTAYHAALAVTEPPKPQPKTQAPRGSFKWLIHSYYASTEFKALRESTRTVYRGAIERFASRYGDLPVDKMRRQDMQAILAKMADRPAAANMTLKMIRVLVRHALDLGIRDTDPTLKLRKRKEGEWRSWTDEEIAAFEAAWPIGTRERLAFALHLYTGQRRGDVAKMTWRDIAGNSIRVVQAKTGAKLTIPLHYKLQEILRSAPREHISILTTFAGKPFAVAGYGNWMHDSIVKAGLPSECVTHGLRKAAGRKLAEAGATSKQIMAVLGHNTLAEAERYTRAADQTRLAADAMALYENSDSQPVSEPTSNPFEIAGKK